MGDLTSPHPAPLSPADEQLLRQVAASGHWLGRPIDELASLVGGIDELAQLGADPLPRVRVDPSGQHAVVTGEIVAAIETPENLVLRDQAAAALGRPLDRPFDDEIETIAHTLLARLLDRAPDTLRATKDPRRIAAALVWAALRGNRRISRHVARDQHRSSDVWWWFGVGDATKLAIKLIRAVGCPGLSERWFESATRPVLVLGDARLLHSRTRTMLIRRRDDWIPVCRDRLEAEEMARPIRDRGDGTFCLRATTYPPLFAFKTVGPTGALCVTVAFGHDDDRDHAEVFALTIPEARRLVALVERALNDRCPDLST